MLWETAHGDKVAGRNWKIFKEVFHRAGDSQKKDTGKGRQEFSMSVQETAGQTKEREANAQPVETKTANRRSVEKKYGCVGRGEEGQGKTRTEIW